MGTHSLSGYKEEIKRCNRIYKGSKESEQFIKAVSSVIDRYFEDNPVTPLPAGDIGESTEQLKAGRSVGLEVVLETKAVVDLLKNMSEAMLKANPKLKDTVRCLKERFDGFLSDSPPSVTKKEIIALRDLLVEEAVLEQDLATFIFSTMLSSFFRQHSRALNEVLPTDLWEGGDCPLCGEKPHFGMLRSEDGAKILECWLCGTQWVHTRIKCPFCNNTELEDLGYFTAESNEVCRVNFCRACCRYYKIFDTRKFHADGNPVLTIHNLATLEFDVLARQEGFIPGSGLEWVNEGEVSSRQD